MTVLCRTTTSRVSLLATDTHGDDPLLGDDFPGISNVYDGHITNCAGRFYWECHRANSQVKFVERVVRDRGIVWRFGWP